MTLKIAPTLDGRRQRSERSQVAIVEAALTLINEEKQVPTAQQIADRAGVSIRSFFRHFADMDALFLSADEMLGASYETLFAVTDRSGTLSQRISRAVDLYGNAFDQLCDLILVLRRWHGVFPRCKNVMLIIRRDCATSSNCGCPRWPYRQDRGEKRYMPSRLLRCGIG